MDATAIILAESQSMIAYPPDVNKTISPTDLKRSEVTPHAKALNQFGRQLWWKRVPYAVNGALRMRFKGIRWNKLWEYSRGLAYCDFKPGMRVLDFGGGATIPLFWLAQDGCEVLSLDIDEKLTAHTNAVAKQMGWGLKGSNFDLTQNDAPKDWQPFDRVVSFCVIEHIPKAVQQKTLMRLASVLKSGGIFALTFDFGENAPVDGAVRSAEEVAGMIASSGLKPIGDGKFHDTGERFAIDKKYPDHRFTFGSLFLQKA